MMRLSTYKNPLGLRIGERVKITKTSIVTYVDGYKTILKIDSSSDTIIIVGSVKKATGTYEKGWEPSFTFDDYCSPRLKVDKYHWFYLGVTNFGQKPVMVHTDDITLISSD